jgi:hypothetical protein
MDHPFVSPAMNDMLLAGSNRIDGKTHDVYELKWTAERLPDHEIRRLPGTMTARHHDSRRQQARKPLPHSGRELSRESL